MKILIIGGTGAAGARITAEAHRRGHEATCASRGLLTVAEDTPRAPALVLDAIDPQQVAHAASQHDVIVAATRPAPGQETAVVATTAGLAEGARRAGSRLVVVGGAAPLLVPGTSRSVLDDPAWIPAEIREFAAASSQQLETLQAANDLNWTYLAPAADFQPGSRSGTYRTGGEDLVIDDNGQSFISMEDYAIAVIDEIETPTASRTVLSIGH